MRKSGGARKSQRAEKRDQYGKTPEERAEASEALLALQGIGRDFALCEDLAEERRKERWREEAKIQAFKSSKP